MKTSMNICNQVIYFINSIFAALLIISYLLPFIPADFIPILSILNFSIPVFILINLLFVVYWFVKLNKRILLSLVAIGIGFSHLTSLYVVNEKLDKLNADLHLLSYNVRHLNMHNWIDDAEITEKINQFLLAEDPDIIALQDFKEKDDFVLENNFPYQYIQHRGRNKNNALAIYSKHPIVNTGNIDFKNTSNNSIYADVVVKNDTIRVYNVHLESLKITPDVSVLKDENQQKLIQRVSHSFAQQAKQTKLISQNLASCNYSKIVMGDFNNTAFSNVYREIKSFNLNDSFKERGNGFGKTFNFDFIPIRIDFILTDHDFKVLNFKNYNVEYSDHFPISTWIQLNNEMKSSSH